MRCFPALTSSNSYVITSTRTLAGSIKAKLNVLAALWLPLSVINDLHKWGVYINSGSDMRWRVIMTLPRHSGLYRK